MWDSVFGALDVALVHWRMHPFVVSQIELLAQPDTHKQSAPIDA
jgi:hypothetical protein